MKNEENAKKFIENSPAKNSISENLISKKMKKSGTKEFDFNDLALNQGYRDLISLYKKALEKHPTLKLEEAMLNRLGLFGYHLTLERWSKV